MAKAMFILALFTAGFFYLIYNEAKTFGSNLNSIQEKQINEVLK
ncbi:hypothetical protein JCM14244_16560 [Venenivibrio stagnispumantis]|uniref:Uncharacterized protein n=1 Tax=Venenivibrio stagnispumantis TaxID=407998 RepID=A0AA45WPG6_9AQUI|nr:hypothetical protein [Venenivibrio stagnispumantis]MCW4573990.1 hypothetical protein [Venenivibrio stagnispumantis]SMP21096.1 hypothetical protein SAMN06264868_1226 [Venenivibrio stagnispumantis]